MIQTLPRVVPVYGGFQAFRERTLGPRSHAEPDRGGDTTTGLGSRLLGRLVARQLRRPRGLFGRVIGRGLARRNKEANDWTVSLLDIQPTDRVLEIGFGPGLAVRST